MTSVSLIQRIRWCLVFLACAGSTLGSAAHALRVGTFKTVEGLVWIERHGSYVHPKNGDGWLPGDRLFTGTNGSAAVILLTDGQRTTGDDPLEAAKLAADYGVRVYTVGVGTVTGETIGFEGWSMRVRLDEESLKAIATKTQAEYFYAGTAQDLKKVYTALSSKLTLQKKDTEISGLMALLGATLALLSAGLSVFWFNRIL